METGFVQIPRSIKETEVWNSGAVGRALIASLYMKAVWAETEVDGVALKPGQLLVSIAQMAEEELETNRVTVNRYVKKLQQSGCIEVVTNVLRKQSLISLINWPTYDKIKGEPVTKLLPSCNEPSVPTTSIYNNKNKNTVRASRPVLGQLPLSSEQDGSPSYEPTAKVTTDVACPHQALINAYHTILPELRKVRIWTGVRQQNMTARWRQMLSSEKKYSDQQSGIEWWKGFFQWIRKSDFLMGRINNSTFKMDLEWLMKAGNFVKVYEGKYHGNR